MASSKVALANISLDLIGATTILSFDDDTNEARIVKRMYEESKKEVMRSHPWNSIRKRVTLSPTVTTPAFYYSNTYQLPSDYLRVLPYGTLADTEYQIEGKKLLSNESSVELIYLANIDDTTVFEALLTKAIALRLAADICYRIVQSNSLVERLEGQYERVLRRAKTINAQEQQSQNLEAEDWLNSRNIGI